MRIRSIAEFDWYISSTQRILKTLAELLNEVDPELGAATEQYQIDDAIDRAENVLGLAFVVAQVYITGTIAMLNRMSRLQTPINKFESLAAFGAPLEGRATTDVQLADAIANFYKHHDEWHDMNKPGPHARTIKTLEGAGIDITDPYPCVQAGEILFPSTTPEYLARLLTMLTRWRERQIDATRKSPAQADSLLNRSGT